VKTALAMIHPAMASQTAHLELSAPQPSSFGAPLPGRVASVSDGWVEVICDGYPALQCEVLHSGVTVVYEAGDRVLILPPSSGHALGVVVGKLVRYGSEAPQQRVTLEASQQVEIKCGASSIDLRADGKVMIRGDDVLVRAKGTNRIRAGTVSIN